MPVTIAAVAGAAQTGIGVYEKLRANKLAKDAMQDYKNNPYQIPSAALESVNLAAKEAQGGRLAGQDIMEEGLASQTAESIAAARKAASTPSQIVVSTVQSYANQQARQRELDLAAEQDRQRRQEIYRNAVMTLAPYQAEAWKWNVLYPIQAKLNKASAMGGSGTQNISSGVGSILGTVANDQYLKSLQGGTTTQGAQTTIPPVSNVTPQQNFQSPWWGGGVPDTSIRQRQGNY